jgi:hypothetical protein
VIAGANSGPGLRSMPMRIVLQDEIDAYPDDVDGEGDPCVLADKRTDQFARAKRFKCSTPKIKGKSRITRATRPAARRATTCRARTVSTCSGCAGRRCAGRSSAARAHVRRVRRHRRDRPRRERRIACQHCKGEVELSAENTRESTPTKSRAPGTSARPAARDRRAPQDGDDGGVARRARAPHPPAPGPGQVLADDDPDPHAIWAMVRGELKRFRPKYTRRSAGTSRRCTRRSAGSPGRRRSSSTSRRRRAATTRRPASRSSRCSTTPCSARPYEVSRRAAEGQRAAPAREAYEQAKVPAGGLLLVAGSTCRAIASRSSSTPSAKARSAGSSTSR